MFSTDESLQVLPRNNETIIEKNWCLEMMSSYNRLLLIYACLKPRRYHNWVLWYLLPTILVRQKRSKFERISGCDYSFIIEKGQFIEWMAKTGLAYYNINSIPLKKRIHCVKSILFGVILVHIFPHSDWIRRDIRENADQNNSEYGHFSRSDDDCRCLFKKHSTLENTRSLQLASWNNDGVT